MSISVHCPGCDKKLKVKDESAGKRVRCPGCAEMIKVPAPRSTVESSEVDSAAAKLPGKGTAADRKAPQGKRPAWVWIVGGAVVAAGLCVVASALIMVALFVWPGGGGLGRGAGGGALTKDKLIGKWKGQLDNGTIEVDFKNQLAVVTIVSGGGFAIGSVGYEIDGGGNDVKVGNAAAKRANDGSLLLSGQFQFGNTTFWIPETRMERAQ